MKFYTSVTEVNKKLLVRGVEDGKRFIKRFPFSPTLFIASKEKTKHRTLEGDYLKPIKFETTAKAREFFEQYRNVPEYKIAGMDRWHYQYIAKEYPDEIKFDKKFIKIFTLDIETTCEAGFPNIDNPIEEIICLTVKNQTNKQIITWGTGEYKRSKDNVTYVQCKDEVTLLEQFLTFWSKNHPDIVTGWNVKFFDLPYLINRMRKILGNDSIDVISPWKRVKADRTQVGAKHLQFWNILGIAVLDYLDLYKKFIPQRQESYKLNYIAKVELGEEKIDNPYETFKDFYTKDYQKFIDYNIQDVELVDRLEDKMKLIELCLTMAYEAKVNYSDVFSQVRMWDTIIFNHLKKYNIVIPQRRDSDKKDQYEGAYVKDPTIGIHNWIVSFDLNSLYPHLIMQYNNSPEKFIGMHTKDINVENLLNEKVDLSWLKEKGITLAPNGAMFKADVQGFLPYLMEKMYNDRVKFKQLEFEAKKEYQKTKDPKLLNEISRCHNIQWAKKIALNSAYGAIGNQYFRFYDRRQAEAITTAGQLAIRWVERDVNKFMNATLGTTDKNYIVASDTDSIYVTMGDLVNKVLPNADKTKIVDFLDKAGKEKIQQIIDKSFNRLAKYTNAFQQKMQMKRENIADKGIWVAKKRYMLNVFDEEGVRYDVPKLKIMGIEAVKSSTPEVCRGKIKEAIKLVMTGDETVLQEFVGEFRKEFMKLLPEQISFPRSCNGMEKYFDRATIHIKGTPMHVKGALMYNHLIHKNKLSSVYPLVNDGDKIKYLALKDPNPLHTNVISYSTTLPKEFEIHKYLDYDMQFQKAFLDPLRFILQSVGWNYEKQNTLEAFFG